MATKVRILPRAMIFGLSADVAPTLRVRRSGSRPKRRDSAGIRATLAQLVEQRFCKAKVPGSNPGGGSSSNL